MKKSVKALLLKFFLVFCLCGNIALANEDVEEHLNSLDNFIYEKPTLANLSQMYWAVSMLDINDKNHIDNFMKINECDIYSDYYHHEFEWKDVRSAARTNIEQNKKSFPLRFEFVQEINLGEYDLDKEVFEVIEEDRIEGIRRFNISALDVNGKICGDDREIIGYPKSFILELSRPFIFKELPLKADLAKKYITKKMEDVRKLRTTQQTQKTVFENRTVYVVMKVKMFAYNGHERILYVGNVPNMLGVLEGFEIYGDRDLKELFYSKSYRTKRKKSSMEEQLKQEYNAQKEQDSSGTQAEPLSNEEVAQ